MQVATIVPTAYLHLTKDDDYFMALAHLVGVDRKYTEFFRARADEGKFVLMDNGVVEGERQNVKELIRRAHLINATEVILPDVIRNGASTIIDSHAALNEMENQGFKLMAVPQGNNVAEWEDCAKTMLLWSDRIDSLGISKFVLNADEHARERCLELIKYDVGKLGVHLLGVWKDVWEVAKLGRDYSFVRGVDSGVAYMFAERGENLSANKVDVKIDFDDNNVDRHLLRLNIVVWRRIASGDM